MFVKGLFSGTIGLLNAVKKDGADSAPKASIGVAFSAPALMWISVFAFGFYNFYYKRKKRGVILGFFFIKSCINIKWCA
jgi:hypothetical protein